MTTVDARAELSALSGPDGSGLRFLVGQYVSLMKPRIIELLLITTIPVMFLAAGGVPNLLLVLATLVGGTLSAGAANTLNCYIDRDIDAVMHRTSKRPLVTGTISPRAALTFGAVLGVASTVWLGLLVNWLSAWLALAALLFYVFGYTLLLKRRTAQNIVWGGAAGCMPVLIGWSAVTGSISWSALILFMVIFFWTPPHYWPLSMRFKQDYAKAEVPMLPVLEEMVVVARQIALYAWAMVLTSLALVPVGSMGWIYTATAVGAGVLFLAEAHRLLASARSGAPESKLRPMRLFHFSITYLTILFVGVALDPIWHLALPGLA
ncbi:heme o synthase [Intrasporangium calvum]|uniref:Protoheme IX farnesyltransferase n=1 Tax=Intrasporangium calvum (strain ATCC 23552 / DSM 43043 / JCM 3097 / NBRC 12989 / NCIMB 10167 / NRRL B-3866 / 7 KIP) TaxID=710696 RepID=E6S9L2_INTC7|nr:protoheme IX farnesyltransferase [Intrasporangium calvum DSM 43043]